MKQDISRVRKQGTSHSVIIPKKIWEWLGWRDMDVVAVMADRSKVVLTRIPLEQYLDTSLTVSGEQP